jgi:hypothetical protein
VGTTLLKNDLSEELYKKIRALKEDHISQVLDFIEYLKSKETKNVRNPLLEFIMAEADPEMTLDNVRGELNGIKGNLSHTVIEGREERF